MNAIELLDIISAGETSKVQFKRELDNQDKVASEMIAFSNAKGGGLFYVDEMVVPDTTINDINKEKVADYVKRIQRDTEEPETVFEPRLYENLNLLKNNHLTLGGLLFFAKDPQKYKPAFCIKAISFFGNSIGGTAYRDSVDITGTIPKLFSDGMRFFNGNLRHVQAGQNFNSTGILEISEVAIEELLQNAILHRDYTKNAPIRLMIFDDRIEIVSPGCLPNSLTIESIKMGNAVVRNNLLISYGSKLMKYRGFGSGIIRAIDNQPNIEFINDVEGEQFFVKIPRIQD
jgi:predicted HTH transcriptional regulator